MVLAGWHDFLIKFLSVVQNVSLVLLFFLSSSVDLCVYVCRKSLDYDTKIFFYSCRCPYSRGGRGEGLSGRTTAPIDPAAVLGVYYCVYGNMNLPIYHISFVHSRLLLSCPSALGMNSYRKFNSPLAQKMAEMKTPHVRCH